MKEINFERNGYKLQTTLIQCMKIHMTNIGYYSGKIFW